MVQDNALAFALSNVMLVKPTFLEISDHFEQSIEICKLKFDVLDYRYQGQGESQSKEIHEL